MENDQMEYWNDGILIRGMFLFFKFSYPPFFNFSDMDDKYCF